MTNREIDKWNLHPFCIHFVSFCVFLFLKEVVIVNMCEKMFESGTCAKKERPGDGLGLK